MASVEGKRWLAVDPGEETGWSMWKGDKLLGGGQTPLWQFAHDLWDSLADSVGPLAEGEETYLRPGVTTADNKSNIPASRGIDLIVCETFVLYPWEAKNLAWDEFRTVQLIGAITFMAALYGVEMHKQPAKIKKRALDGGAAELFDRPLHDQRHTNDSRLHGFHYLAVECHNTNLGTRAK